MKITNISDITKYGDNTISNAKLECLMLADGDINLERDLDNVRVINVWIGPTYLFCTMYDNVDYVELLRFINEPGMLAPLSRKISLRIMSAAIENFSNKYEYLSDSEELGLL